MSKKAEILSAVYADARLNVANPELAISAYARHTKMKIQVFDGNDLEAAFEDGYEQAEKDTIERAIQWLRERVNIPYDVETNEDGEPLADSYIDYAKKRLEAANEIVEDFRKAMEDE